MLIGYGKILYYLSKAFEHPQIWLLAVRKPMDISFETNIHGFQGQL